MYPIDEGKLISVVGSVTYALIPQIEPLDALYMKFRLCGLFGYPAPHFGGDAIAREASFESLSVGGYRDMVETERPAESSFCNVHSTRRLYILLHFSGGCSEVCSECRLELPDGSAALRYSAIAILLELEKGAIFFVRLLLGFAIPWLGRFVLPCAHAGVDIKGITYLSIASVVYIPDLPIASIIDIFDLLKTDIVGILDLFHLCLVSVLDRIELGLVLLHHSILFSWELGFRPIVRGRIGIAGRTDLVFESLQFGIPLREYRFFVLLFFSEGDHSRHITLLNSDRPCCLVLLKDDHSRCLTLLKGDCSCCLALPESVNVVVFQTLFLGRGLYRNPSRFCTDIYTDMIAPESIHTAPEMRLGIRDACLGRIGRSCGSGYGSWNLTSFFGTIFLLWCHMLKEKEILLPLSYSTFSFFANFHNKKLPPYNQNPSAKFSKNDRIEEISFTH